MGHPDGAHTHGSGGNGLPRGGPRGPGRRGRGYGREPVLAAVAELLHVLMIAAGVIVGIGVAAVAACLRGGGAAGRQARPAPRPASHEGGAGRSAAPTGTASARTTRR